MPPRETRALHSTAAGDALGTTRVLIPVAIRGKLRGEGVLGLIANAFSTAVVGQISFNPRLLLFTTADGMLSFTDQSDAAQDGSAATSVVLNALPALLNGGAIYVGAGVPFRGLDVDVDGPNGDASVMAVHFWNGSAWTDISPTDNTDSGGDTLAQDGEVTWTVPATWEPAALYQILGIPDGRFSAGDRGKLDQAGFWLRISFSAALDAAVTLDHVLPTNRSTAEAELTEDLGFEYPGIRTDFPNGLSCIEARTDAGTAALIANLTGAFES